MKYAQLVIGPAGCGKSTYCFNIQQHCATLGRSVHVVNLDPAAEDFQYSVSFDVRDLITLDDVMTELQLGPNGGLIYCMEYLETNLQDWLGEELEAYGEDDYLVFDCPGQIELYSHIPVLRSFVEWLKNDGWNVAAVFCLDSGFVGDASKYIAGSFQALAAMVSLELPHVNVLTKMDLCANKDEVEGMLFPDSDAMLAALSHAMPPKFYKLNQAVARLLDDYGTVGFVALDPTDEDSLADVLLQVDMCIQYGEDMEPKTTDFDHEYDPSDHIQ